MIKLSPCIEALYNKLPFIERIEKVANAGIGVIEFWGWGGKDIEMRY
jgi:hydroxypyruvate isomerase